jgi:hypothetical protein
LLSVERFSGVDATVVDGGVAGGMAPRTLGALGAVGALAGSSERVFVVTRVMKSRILIRGSFGVG